MTWLDSTGIFTIGYYSADSHKAGISAICCHDCFVVVIDGRTSTMVSCEVNNYTVRSYRDVIVVNNIAIRRTSKA